MESTLALKVTDIQAKLGAYAGYGRGALFGDPAWTSSQQATLDDATQSGLRRFYYPMPQQGSKEGYAWSFLRPTVTLLLQSGASTVPLPDDFGGFEGSVTLQSTAGYDWGPIKFANPGEVDAKFSVLPTTSGRPVMASIMWVKGTTQTAGQRAQLYFWPLADTNYNIRFQYYIQADYLNGSYPYALGGMAHVETILESCLAVMEERLDDIPMGAGPHGIAFAARLQASISMDRKSKAAYLGYNGDNSDGLNWRRDENHYESAIQYNGIVY